MRANNSEYYNLFHQHHLPRISESIVFNGEEIITISTLLICFTFTRIITVFLLQLAREQVMGLFPGLVDCLPEDPQEITAPEFSYLFLGQAASQHSAREKHKLRHIGHYRRI